MSDVPSERSGLDFDRQIHELIKPENGVEGVKQAFVLLFKDTRNGMTQPEHSLEDSRSLQQLVGLNEFLAEVVKYPSLSNEFKLLYLNLSYPNPMGSPLLREVDYQNGLVMAKVDKMNQFLSDFGLENIWSVLDDSERRVALASLYDQLMMGLVDALMNRQAPMGQAINTASYGVEVHRVMEA